jgi:hypothetical protein
MTQIRPLDRLPANRPARAGDDLTALTFPQQFVVWSVRVWVDGHRTGVGRAHLLREAYALAGAAEGWLLVEELMTVIAVSARRALDMRCPTCRQIGEDEAAFLDAVASLQAGESAKAIAVLADWLPPSGARIAFGVVERLAAILAKARLCLPAPERPRLPDRGLTLVH